MIQSSVCLSPSVCLWLWRSVLWLNDTFCSKSVRTSEKEVPMAPRNMVFNSYSDPIPSQPILLNNSCWCHLANTLTPCCEQTNRQHFHVWNNRLSMLHDYSRIRGTIPLSQQQLGSIVLRYIWKVSFEQLKFCETTSSATQRKARQLRISCSPVKSHSRSLKDIYFGSLKSECGTTHYITA